ncbi:DNA helicase MCM8 [Hydra vulgaris]|uniref:DNA helicase MCM8 n=1 Tax=Hydra vulgaris TaxID=6087 RepID=UPI0002B47AAA|nr:DNA helicase MCM8 isoform X1 [Hydra vulgaris]
MNSPYVRGGFKGNRGKSYGWRQKKSGYLSKNIKGVLDSLQSSSQRSQPINFNHNIGCPYAKWELYFKNESYNPESELADKVFVLYQYFETCASEFQDEIEEKQEVHLDYQTLLNNPMLLEKFPSLKKDIYEDPENILASIGVTLHQVLLDEQIKADKQTSHVFPHVPFINVRLVNFEPVTAFKHLKANSYGKLVSVRGTVVRVSNVKPIVTKMEFSCNSCTENQVICLAEGKYAVPTKCINEVCRGKSFSPLRSSPSTETIDWQNIKIQEMISDEHREAGRIPRTVECELTSGLVDSCVPGDVITCTGIVKVTSEENNMGKTIDTSIYILYIHAISITNNKDSQNNVIEDGSSEFTLKELYAIREIQEEQKLFRLIVGSLCPTIYGLLLVKAGLALALFGGSQKYVDSKNLIPVRSDIHVLIVGDPGLGKSQILQAVANIAPRSVYVCGSTTTTTGLTVTLSKESGTGNYSLEAGALVLADKGCCCIDEFDKMGSQHQALLEAMEQQSISIAKAGILCSLPARTSILAAANPVGGHYNRGKTVSENLKMGSALLSRFDLVFVLLDQPDEELDGILSEHVVSLHSNLDNIPSVTVERNKDVDGLLDQWNEDKPLIERLKIDKNESFDALPPQLLRKYIQYARKYVHPELSQDAVKVLQDFYLNLRNARQDSNSMPITTRQLEALIRLTEARARLELRENATAQDARDVIEIMKSSLIDTLTNEHGSLDYSRSQNGSGMSKRYQAKKFISELNEISERNNSSLFHFDQMLKIAKQLKLDTDNFGDFISSLNIQNFLLMKGPKLYQLQTSSCL